MPQPTAQQTSHVARGATVATAIGVGALAAPPAVVAVGATATVVTLASIMAALLRFLAALAAHHRAWLTRELGRYSSVPSDIAVVVEDEMRLEREFARNSADRVAKAMPAALRIADPEKRAAAVEQILALERQYAEQRQEAMTARAVAAITRTVLRRESPLGAFWRIGHARDHTQGCLFMTGKFWPWAVLDRVHPPRHYGCTSRLFGFGEAVHEGWMTAGDVPDTLEAIRRAAGVVMESEEALELERELEVRGRLLEAGVDRSVLERLPWAGVGVQGEIGGEGHGAT